jgi:NADPH:quinone reductase-like Zn-dependent oxidoreductase
MQAITRTEYGGPEVLHLEEIDKPSIKEDHILVKVFANSANPADWHILRGEPVLARIAFGLFKPKNKVIGADFAGIVEEVGSKVTGFQPGDKVFGEALESGAFAEYLCAPANFCAKMPDKVDFATMACLPIAGLTALQALISHGKLKEGESILINGASGGVGHLTVQIAKAYGAIVTGVCSGKNTEFVKSLGVDNVIAYDEVNIHQHNGKYDLIIDTHGNLNHHDFTRMGKRGVLIGFTTLGHLMSVLLGTTFSRFPLAQFTAKANTTDLETVAALLQAGKIKVNIDKTFSYKEIPEAIRYIEAIHTRGKVAMVWDENFKNMDVIPEENSTGIS